MSIHPRNVTAACRDRVLSTQRLSSKAPLLGVVRQVKDGDTLVVELYEDDERLSRIEYVRLAGLDAAELKGPDVAAALRAKRALADLCFEKLVQVTPTRIWRDPYHRIIARVVTAKYVTGDDLGWPPVIQPSVSFPADNDLAAKMIASGLAKELKRKRT